MRDVMRKRIEANGGHGPNYGKHFSEQACKNISESQKRIADKTRARMLGKKLSEETIAKRTAARIEKYGKYTANWSNGGALKGSDNAMSKRVRCIETGVEYPSAIEAAQQTGITYYHICENARGKRKIAGGFHWEYLDPPKKRKPQSEETKERRRGANSKMAKPVRCIETGEIFPAVSLLAEALNVRRPIVTKFLKKDGVYNGLHYEYVKKEQNNHGIGIQESQT